MCGRTASATTRASAIRLRRVAHPVHHGLGAGEVVVGHDLAVAVKQQEGEAAGRRVDAHVERCPVDVDHAVVRRDAETEPAALEAITQSNRSIESARSRPSLSSKRL